MKKQPKVKIEEEIIEAVEEVPEVEAAPDLEMEVPLEESPVVVKEPVKTKGDSKMGKEKQGDSALPQKKTKSKKAKHAGMMFSVLLAHRLSCHLSL